MDIEKPSPPKWKMQLAKEMTGNVPIRFQRRKMYSSGVDDLWALDLMDFTRNFVSVNRNHRYALIAIDVFSRYVFGVPMKNKNAFTTTQAFERILEESNTKPKLITCDHGSEFFNQSFKKMLEKNDIKIYSTFQDVKSSIVERVIRTLRKMIKRHFIVSNSTVWYNALSSIITEYNHKKHRSIRMSPLEARKSENHDLIYETQFPNSFKKQIPAAFPKFLTGDKVRISMKRQTFSKEPGWSEQVYIIDGYKPGNPPVYTIKDLNGTSIEGTFYENQMKPTDQNIYRIDKVLKKRTTKNGKKQVFVRWSGYDDDFNSWIDESSIEARKT